MLKGETTMVSDQEIAKGVETLLRQSDPNAVNTVNGFVQQLGAKLGLDLSHKAGFIRDQINYFLRQYPPQPPPSLQTLPGHQGGSFKEHFVLQHNQHHQVPVSPHQFHHHTQFGQQPQLLPHRQQQQHQFPSHFNLNFAGGFHGQLLPSTPPSLPQQHQRQRQPQTQIQFQSVPQPHVQPGRNVASAGATEKPAKESASAGTKRRGGSGGLNKVCGVSPELQVVVGESALPRTEIVKQLWAYIRKNNLQDPSNKRKIICDDALRAVFEIDCTDMFKMNKLLSKHITPLGSPKESAPAAKRAKVEAEPAVESGPAVETTEPTTQNVVPQETNKESPVIISDALAAFLGTTSKEMIQSEATQQVLEYVRINHLEDLNSRMVMCDAKLKELFGAESIPSMEIAETLARQHLFKSS